MTKEKFEERSYSQLKRHSYPLVDSLSLTELDESLFPHSRVVGTVTKNLDDAGLMYGMFQSYSTRILAQTDSQFNLEYDERVRELQRLRLEAMIDPALREVVDNEVAEEGVEDIDNQVEDDASNTEENHDNSDETTDNQVDKTTTEEDDKREPKVEEQQEQVPPVDPADLGLDIDLEGLGLSAEQEEMFNKIANEVVAIENPTEPPAVDLSHMTPEERINYELLTQEWEDDKSIDEALEEGAALAQKENEEIEAEGVDLEDEELDVSKIELFKEEEEEEGEEVETDSDEEQSDEGKQSEEDKQSDDASSDEQSNGDNSDATEEATSEPKRPKTRVVRTVPITGNTFFEATYKAMIHLKNNPEPKAELTVGEKMLLNFTIPIVGRLAKTRGR